MNGKAQAALRSGCREDRRSAAGRGRFHGHGVDGRSSHGAGFGAGRHIGLHDAASQFLQEHDNARFKPGVAGRVLREYAQLQSGLREGDATHGWFGGHSI